MKKRLTLALMAVGALALFIAACTSEKEVPVEVIKEVVVEKEVVTEKVVVKEVPVEKEVVVVKEVEKVVVATAMPVAKSVEVERAKYGGTIKVTAQASMKTLDARISFAAVTIVVAMHMHNQLFAWDLNFDSAPQMVDNWSVSSDGKTYEFELRSGLTFHDGSAVTTADLIPSLKAWTQDKSGALVTTFAVDQDNVVEAVDDRTFQIRLIRPFCCVLQSFTLPGRTGGVIYPKHIAALDPYKDVGEENYVGTGPYKLGKWDIGHKLVLERYEGYIPRTDPGGFLAGAQIPYFDKIELLEIPSEETKIAGLKTAEWDVVDDPALDFFEDLKGQPGITTVVNRPGKMSNVNFHNQVPPTDNKKVRQAILAAIDVDKFMNSLTSSEELWGHCPSVFFCFHAREVRAGEEEFYDQDNLPRAQQLLAESGYDGEEFYLMNPNDYGTITPLGPVFKAMLEDIGLKVSMPGLDWSTVVSHFNNYDDYTWNAFTSWGSFGFQNNPLFNGHLGLRDFKHYESERISSLLDQYASTGDYDEQQRLAGELMLTYYDDVPGVHFGQFFGIVPHLDKVKNLTPRIYTAFTNAYFEE